MRHHEGSKRSIGFDDEHRIAVPAGLVPRHVLRIHTKRRFEDVVGHSERFIALEQ
jgi:hypothetical protein